MEYTTLDRNLTYLGKRNLYQARLYRDSFDHFLAGKTSDSTEYLVGIVCSGAALDKEIAIYLVYWDQHGRKDAAMETHFPWPRDSSMPTKAFMLVKSGPRVYSEANLQSVIEVIFPEEVEHFGKSDVTELARHLFCAVKPWLHLYPEIIAEIDMDYKLNEWLVDLWKDLGSVPKEQPKGDTGRVKRMFNESKDVVCDLGRIPVKVFLRDAESFGGQVYFADCIPRIRENITAAVADLADNPAFHLSSFLGR